MYQPFEVFLKVLGAGPLSDWESLIRAATRARDERLKAEKAQTAARGSVEVPDPRPADTGTGPGGATAEAAVDGREHGRGVGINVDARGVHIGDSFVSHHYHPPGSGPGPEGAPTRRAGPVGPMRSWITGRDAATKAAVVVGLLGVLAVVVSVPALGAGGRPGPAGHGTAGAARRRAARRARRPPRSRTASWSTTRRSLTPPLPSPPVGGFRSTSPPRTPSRY